MNQKKKILIFSLLFASLLIIFLKFGTKDSSNDQLISSRIIPSEMINEMIEDKENKEEKEQSVSQIQDTMWKLIIPRIGLEKEIQEGTSSNTMKSYIGHFEDTEKWNGNIGLAAHNRGYGHNFFSKIHVLEIGDKMIYIANNKMKEYRVNFNNTISEKDWSYLKKSEKDKITLITCEIDKPEIRRCVQAIVI